MDRIAAAQQFRAIAYLRWCLFRNGFRRKGGAGELVARIIVYPFAALLIIGPVTGATLTSYFAISTGHPAALNLVFWAIFALQILVSIQIAAPGLSFDPESLIRFPLTFARYLTVRTFLGLLSASNVVLSLCLVGSAAGITLAQPALAPVAFAAALALALTNMFFVGMIFAWVDRWLSTRRARELFTGFFIVFGFGIQYLNFTYNPGFHRGHNIHSTAQLARGLHFYHAAEPFLSKLPPSLASRAILNGVAGSTSSALLHIVLVLVWGAIFLAVFAWRMQREYRGENLSEANISSVISLPTPPSSVARPASMAPASLTPRPWHAETQTLPETNTARRFQIPPTVAACLYKEWIYLRRNTAQFYGLLAPIAMVFLFTLRIGSHLGHSTWLFPAAVAYSVLGVSALAYNSLGLDAAGVQLYFLAPIHMGDVMLAKNLFSFAVNAFEIIVIYALISYVAGPPPLPTLLGTTLWLIVAVLVNAAIGNIRSITTPKKLDPSKLSRKQASQLSALMALGIMLAIAGIGMLLLSGAAYLGYTWLPVPILAALAAGAFALYWTGLKKIDTLAQNHRETMIEELAKASS